VSVCRMIFPFSYWRPPLRGLDALLWIAGPYRLENSVEE
jgi:hypothetical protein